jgi:lipopolysaccharide/colanic/teichoic acid biosynthesis glycosyltransferase
MMTAHFNEIPSDAQAVTPAPLRVKTLYASVLKRAIDVTLVLASAPLTLPVVLGMAAFVAIDGHNPFFTQKRVGRDARRFTLVKLRTMVPEAERQLASHLEKDAAARDEWEATQKLKSDPRVTYAGRILRKTSLDELPQLWNVLIGDMSLVGPRPILPEQCDMYPGSAYYTVRPGTTGPWQVSARNECEFKGRAKYDALYARKISFRTDVALLARTVTTVLRGTGY